MKRLDRENVLENSFFNTNGFGPGTIKDRERGQRRFSCGRADSRPGTRPARGTLTYGQLDANVRPEMRQRFDINAPAEAIDEPQTAAVLAQRVDPGRRTKAKALTAVDHVQHGNSVAPLERDVDRPRRMPHDVPDELAKNDLGGMEIAVRRAFAAQLNQRTIVMV